MIKKRKKITKYMLKKRMRRLMKILQKMKSKRTQKNMDHNTVMKKRNYMKINNRNLLPLMAALMFKEVLR